MSENDHAPGVNDEAPFPQKRQNLPLSAYLLAGRILNGAVLCIGLAVLAGWALDIGALKSILPAFVAMKVNTALSFILISISVLLLSWQAQWAPARRLPQIFAAGVMLLSLLTLSEYLLGLNLGIDQLLFAEKSNAVGTLSPGRMAPITAVNFILCGCIILMMPVRRLRVFTQSLSLLVGWIGMVGFTCYLYNGTWKIGLGHYYQMAVHTSILFMGVCGGLLLLKPDEGLMRPVTGNTLGGWLLNRLIPMIIAALMALGWFWLAGEKHGLFEDAMGAALIMGGLTLLLTGLVYWVALSLNHFEKERQQAESKIRESNHKLKQYLDAAPDGVFLTDFSGRFLGANPKVCRMTGYSEDELKTMKLDEWLHPDFKRETSAPFWDFWQTGSVSLECWIKRKDGSKSFFAVNTVRLTETQVLGFCKDITDRKRAEFALQESTEKFRAIANYAVGWESWLAPDGRYLWVNPGVERISGYTADEILAMPDFITTLIAPEDRETVKEQLQEARNGGRMDNFEFRFVHKNGAKFWLSASWQPLFGENGKFMGVRSSAQEITERKQVELEIKEANDQFELIFNTSPDGTLITSLEGEIINVNERMGAALGYTREELIGQSIYTLRIWHDPEEREKFVDLLKTQGHCENYEAVTECKDGSLLIGLISAKIIQLHGEPHIFSITRDITGRKQAEKAAHLISETQARLLRIDRLEEAYRLIGAKVHELIGEGYLLTSMLDEGNQGTKLLEILGLGNLLNTVIATVGFDPANTVYLFKEMPEGALRPYESGKLEPCSLYDLFLHRVPKLACESLKRLLNIHYFYSIGLNWDNRHFGGLLICVPHDLADRALAIETLVSQGAITIHRLWVEKELRLRNVILSAQQETSIDGVLVVDANNEILSSNHRFSEMWEIPDALIGTKDDTLVLNWVVSKTAHPEEFLSQVKRLYDARTQTSQDEIPLKDGRIFERYSAPMHDAQGNYYGRIWYFHDITQRRALYDQLYQAQKMESIGRLASGIAHEINTPTQYVGDNVHFLLDSFQTSQDLLEAYAETYLKHKNGVLTADATAALDAKIQAADTAYLAEEIPKAFKQTLDGIERISTIVRAMKEFAHPGKVVMEPVDLNHAIQSTLIVARNEWKYVADLITEFDPALPQVPCLVNEFNQVILNLVVNSAHAIAEAQRKESDGLLASKGKITVSTRRAGDQAEIRIADTGCGIPEEIRSKIFEPFFTTKPVGQGTGQGLAISRNVIVEKHRGSIEVESEVSRGATFILRLPLAGEKE